ncbi:IPT/TIG domain-containing protein [Robiginitalea sediminis]|uniref:IPT/TIG domain-containing protein n=1 Tax=Robiginitalea sediminis TaxID=1982593 RepID=UPI000B4B08F3|nr:IPT/TIG domain-containing protein [Robiginitalea sediminis]
MKTPRTLFFLFLSLLTLASCSDDADAPEFALLAYSPETGAPGTEVTLTGSGFPSDPSEVSVTIGGVAAPVVSVSETRIVVSVPAGAASGEIRVTANGVTRTSSGGFTVLSQLVAETFSNLEAPQTGSQGEPEGGPFTKFSFATGQVTESETEWDIAFRGTTLAVNGGAPTGTADEPERNGNGGAAIQDGTFAEITSAEGLTFAQDAPGAYAIPTGSGNGWYNYNPATFTINPIPGKILVFRTHDGRYAKVEILSYYRDAPAQPDPFTDESRVYTFRYVYNPNQGEMTLAQ